MQGIILEKSYCSWYVSTFQFGNVNKKEDTNISKIRDISDLYLHAIGRGVDIDQSTEEICKQIKDQLPTLEWQLNNMIEISNKELVSEEELNIISSYKSYGYESMNNNLRYNKNAESPINDIISRTKGLDKDIIVFRIVDIRRLPKEFINLQILDIYNQKGYFSTTIDVMMMAESVCKDPKKSILMKIYVPKNKKAIYFPSEGELLFPHDINLQLISKNVGKYVCNKNTGKTEEPRKTCYVIDDVTIYTFKML
jgi:hypothetical protein